jgi:hypothetical protein
MLPGEDHLPPDHPDYMEGWYYNCEDGAVHGPQV